MYFSIIKAVGHEISFEWASLLTLSCQNGSSLESSALTASKITCRDSDKE